VKTYDVYKMNASGQTWWAGAVEAADADTALRLARDRFPSRNPADTHSVAERSPERQAEIDRAEVERSLRGDPRPVGRRKERLIAYHDRLRRNKNAALSKNVGVLGHPAPVIQEAAARIDAEFDAKAREIEGR
jgi:1,2-phenylacetyl-CoA epoxidase PaaB subunit